MNNILNVQNLNKSFPEGTGDYLKVIKNINFSMSEGEFALIMGPSGSGKTTLLSLLGGMLPVSSGKVFITGSDIMSFSQSELSRFRLANIGFVFQSFKLLSYLKVIDNVALVLKLSGMRDSLAGGKSYEILEEVGLAHRVNYYPDKLSGGEKQKAAVARALVADPKIILADEPTGSLDSGSGQNIIEILNKLAKKKNKTVVVVSHDERIRNYADRLFKIEDGILTE